MKYLFFSLRPEQWVKNLFIFLPLVFGKRLFSFPVNFETAVAFFLFSLAASAAYLINDLIDLDKDKLHPAKGLRPIASGKVSVFKVKLAACFLGVLSTVLSFMFNFYFGWVIATYLILNFIYSKILKEAVIIDVFCIGIFFLMRVVAGSIIAGTQLSHWIVIMTTLLALFLGFNKRRQELQRLKGFPESSPAHREVLTKYDIYFIDQMIAVVTSSIVVVYMLYTVDLRTLKEFGTNKLLYSIPFVYYGIFRYLYLIHKCNKEGDPTSILLSDRKMQLNLALWIAVCISVIYFRF